MKQSHTVFSLFTCAALLFTLSGILMALCGSLLYAGLLWASASCLFFTARQMKLSEAQRREMEELDDML